MKKYKEKIEVIVEAVQFTRENFDKLKIFTDNSVSNLTIERRINGNCTCVLSTAQYVCILNEYDYVVKDQSGIFRVFDQKRFNETFKEV